MLQQAGYRVTEVPFVYSDAPGRLGTPVVGIWTGLTLAAAASAGAARRPRAALGRLAVGASALVAAGTWVARAGTVRLRWGRAMGLNLVATPTSSAEGEDELPGGLLGAGVRVWLVAHLDSKSQPVPMAARVGGVTAAIGCAVLAAGIATGEVVRGRALLRASRWRALGACGVIAAIPIAATTVGSTSDGALDNASGAAAVLAAAERLAAAGTPVGVLLTSAEELGLAGAHAWAAAWAGAGRAPGIALNCDGVDDVGPLTVLRGARMDGRVARAIAGAGADVRIRRIPPGLLVDAVALAAAGWSAVTVSKGTWGTLARVHTRRDTLGRLRGDGLENAAALLMTLARRLV